MEHLWAPWRIRYVAQAPAANAAAPSGCFFCHGWEARPDEAKDHLVLARAGAAMAMLNRYPYNAGHIMVVPARHVAACRDLTDAEAADIWKLTVKAQEALGRLMRPDGFNLGLNEGSAAGAGVASHLHWHVVPRWKGDHNYMTVCADARVVPEALEDTWARLEAIWGKGNTWR